MSLLIRDRWSLQLLSTLYTLAIWVIVRCSFLGAAATGSAGGGGSNCGNKPAAAASAGAGEPNIPLSCLEALKSKLSIYIKFSAFLCVRYARSNQWVDLDQTMHAGSLLPRAAYLGYKLG